MSLQTLLVDFPNYSARKIRRLAKQVALLAQAVDHVDEPNLIKGIETDLMEYNLIQAQKEHQLNDDLRVETPPMDVEDIEGSERIHVTPVAEARRALQTMLEWMRVNTDAKMKEQDLNELVAKCQGIVYGQSFHADRTIIQARMSPQGEIELDSDRLARGDIS